MCDWIAAATSYSTHGVPMIPFYIFYSMFGFQRVGDLAWAAGDMRSRGFLLGGTAGRTTLNGEGLQHEDGHSHLISATIPNCISYDPTFGYEVAVIIQDGLRRMYAEQQDVYYYLTVMNENYRQPAMPEGAAPAIIKGMYLFRAGDEEGEGAARAAAGLRHDLPRGDRGRGRCCKSDWGVESDLWSCPSFTELARDGMAVARDNLLNPTAQAEGSRTSTTCLDDTQGPVIAATDYIRAFAEQIRAYVPRRYVVLGTDGFGRSDTREKLRRFFEVDRYYVTVAALKALADEGALPAAKVGRGDEEVRRSTRRSRRRGPCSCEGQHERAGRIAGAECSEREARGSPMSTIEVKVPDIGDFTDIPVIEIFVKPGDAVKAEDSLVTLESDKATMDVPSPSARHGQGSQGQAGRQGQRGHADRRARGERGARPRRRQRRNAAAAKRRLRRSRDRTRPPRAPPAAPAPAARGPVEARRSRRTASGTRRQRSVQGRARIAVGAQVRARAGRRSRARHGHRSEGPHPAGGRAELRQAGDERRAAPRPRGGVAGGGSLNLLPWPTVDFAKFGPVEARPLSRIKKISGANLARNWVMIPHVTQFDEADITDLEAFRVALNKENEKAGIKVTMLAFLIKASVAALRRFPDFNASLDGDNLVLKQYFHIGFAADTPNGLVVPVIKNADQKGVLADRQGDGRALREGARGQARSGRHAGRLLLDLQPRRHRRHRVHADHQCAGGRDPRRVEERDEAGMGRQGVRAATDGAAVASPTITA